MDDANNILIKNICNQLDVIADAKRENFQLTLNLITTFTAELTAVPKNKQEFFLTESHLYQTIQDQSNEIIDFNTCEELVKSNI